MKLQFSLRLYPLPAIEKAAQAFQGLGEIRIRERGKSSVEVTFSRVAPEFKGSLADEFANYVLSEAKP